MKTENTDWRMSPGSDLHLGFLNQVLLTVACLKLWSDCEQQNKVWYIRNIIFLYIHKIKKKIFFYFPFFHGYEAGYLLFTEAWFLENSARLRSW